jgi:hypothetical protein
MARRILSLLENRNAASRLALAARARVDDEFSVLGMMNGYLGLYR